MDCDKEEQEDGKLSGTFSDARPVPEAPATGTVKGNKIVLGWEMECDKETTFTVAFKNAIESATKMTGAVGSPFCDDDCEWTATKKK